MNNDLDKVEKQRAFQQMALVSKVKCPVCFAEIGIGCANTMGQPVSVHGARWGAFKRLKKQEAQHVATANPSSAR